MRYGQMRASKRARPTGMRGGGEGGRRAGAGPHYVSTRHDMRGGGLPGTGRGGGVVADRDGVVPAQALAQLVPADGGFAPVEEGGQRHARAGQRRATCWRGAGGKGGGIEWGKEEGGGAISK